eukprot:Unigene11878_Nuclearia_a/m.36173 Unigene11878_Nuclearia_a/g.36173  ORF Unigene11878_Nuclearia_a/g.36173 Unigene11878_Nuclearia_a/m.36173 type:complete len:339 (+) Unigene11878_Nuclearia_a:118-1134(+)
MMRAIVQTAPKGGPETLVLSESVAHPGEPLGTQVLVRVHTTAVNRADLLQREGGYAPPPGASAILGLECAGVVERLGPYACGRFAVGARVMALLSGGGYAEYVLVPEEHLLPVPDAFSFEQAAAVPEVWLTAYQLLRAIGRVQPGESVLIHAGASGVGTAAIQLCAHVFGARAIASVGSDAKREAVLQLGATAAFNYKTAGAFSAFVKAQTGERGCELVLDPVGASNWAENAESCAMDGRWVLFGSMGGLHVEGAMLGAVLRKRLTLTGTTLRNRSDAYKAALVADFAREVLPRLVDGALRPVVHAVLPLRDAADAHRLVAERRTNETVGKVVLQVGQ